MLYRVKVLKEYLVVVNAEDSLAARTIATAHVEGESSKKAHVYATLTKIDEIRELSPRESEKDEKGHH